MMWPICTSDVNKDWTCKDKDKDFTYSYLLQVAAKPTIAIKQQQPRAGSGVVRMDPLRFLAGCRTRRLNQA